ncbi:hypothetical protein BKA70DRAFT_508263 [Coprinopsis sp. MPI-PUGE-AT-0042]|nr:hypothetical protein BKA70DRAFT_508263 [Coprinopsis sp. MPI-PUGE-AT-0042]
MTSNCEHSALATGPSRYASISGFNPPTQQQIKDALSTASSTTSQTRRRDANAIQECSPGTFPAPLVLPNDELFYDPECPGQTMKEWAGERKKISAKAKRKVVYVAAPPSIHKDASFIQDWTLPTSLVGKVPPPDASAAPRTGDVLEYLEAFYHGVAVRPFPTPLSFGLWEDEEPAPKHSRGLSKSSSPRYISLQTSTSATRVRVRTDPDKTFPKQLCLDDILDLAIEELPADAYALLLVVEHDLYEGDDDDFCCGRAYGGSRVAVVSGSRYRPELDVDASVERVHAWPASHCQLYIEECCAAYDREQGGSKRKKGTKRRKLDKEGPEDITGTSQSSLRRPLELAVKSHNAALASLSAPLPQTRSLALSELWLSRVCRTAAHELGHCFGIDHCVYYACSMQGTASLGEDARQPPYLCPVDLAKLLSAIGGTASAEQRTKDRYEAIKRYCAKHTGTPLFDAFAAWIEGRLLDLAFQ